MKCLNENGKHRFLFKDRTDMNDYFSCMDCGALWREMRI